MYQEKYQGKTQHTYRDGYQGYVSQYDSDRVEHVRKAVLKHEGTVTVGDIITETGFNHDDAKGLLCELMRTHEGALRVSQEGDLIFAFAQNVPLRDARSWWARHKQGICRKGIQVFKIVFMLVFLFYFAIPLFLIIMPWVCVLIIIVLMGGIPIDFRKIFIAIWCFLFGAIEPETDYHKSKVSRVPFYQRLCNFVFGPQDFDNLEQTRILCAQLIRAKNGVITADDWILVSGTSRKQAESDLARFTAEFGGDAEISENGTLVYIFENMMKSTAGKAVYPPSPAWKALEPPVRLTGNLGKSNAGIIIINSICLFVFGALSYTQLSDLISPEAAKTVIDIADLNSPDFNIAELNSSDVIIVDSSSTNYKIKSMSSPELASSVSVWGKIVFAFFPFLFSLSVFLIPLCRVPGNIRENIRRRVQTVKKAALSAFLPLTKGCDNAEHYCLELSDFSRNAEHHLQQFELEEASEDELKTAVSSICDDFNAEMGEGPDSYVFDSLLTRMKDAEDERTRLELDNHSDRIVFSSDNAEQEQIVLHDEASAMQSFDNALNGAGCYPGYARELPYTANSRDAEADSYGVATPDIPLENKDIHSKVLVRKYHEEREWILGRLRQAIQTREYIDVRNIIKKYPVDVIDDDNYRMLVHELNEGVEHSEKVAKVESVIEWILFDFIACPKTFLILGAIDAFFAFAFVHSGDMGGWNTGIFFVLDILATTFICSELRINPFARWEPEVRSGIAITVFVVMIFGVGYAVTHVDRSAPDVDNSVPAVETSEY